MRYRKAEVERRGFEQLRHSVTPHGVTLTELELFDVNVDTRASVPLLLDGGTTDVADVQLKCSEGRFCPRDAVWRTKASAKILATS